MTARAQAWPLGSNKAPSPRRPSWFAPAPRREPAPTHFGAIPARSPGIPKTRSIPPKAAEPSPTAALHSRPPMAAEHDGSADAPYPPIAFVHAEHTCPPVVDYSEALATLTTALEQARASVESARREALDESEGELVRLAMAIAERIVGRELTVDPKIVTGWARQGIEALGSVDSVKCVVSSDVGDALEETSAWAPEGIELELMVDPTLPERSCEVRGRYGRVDAGLEARLDGLARSLGVDRKREDET